MGKEPVKIAFQRRRAAQQFLLLWTADQGVQAGIELSEARLAQVFQEIELPCVFLHRAQQHVELHLKLLGDAGFHAAAERTVKHHAGQTEKHGKQDADGRQQAGLERVV